jgi:hypothetical protein
MRRGTDAVHGFERREEGVRLEHDWVDERDVGSDEEVIRLEHDWTDERELGPAITNAVAVLTDTPPERVGTDLRRRVDFEGLEAVFCPMPDGRSRDDARLVISVESCAVTVAADGRVWIERRSADRQ